VKFQSVALLAAFLMTSPALASPPAGLYTLNCWGCHRSHAEGVPGRVPPLANSMAYFLYIPEGRAFLVQVPGVASSSLSDSEVADVLNWLLVTFNKQQLPKDFNPYTADEVRRFRPHQLVGVTKSRQVLVKRLAKLGIRLPEDEAQSRVPKSGTQNADAR
jgi:hypothetical protein